MAEAVLFDSAKLSIPMVSHGASDSSAEIGKPGGGRA